MSVRFGSVRKPKNRSRSRVGTGTGSATALVRLEPAVTRRKVQVQVRGTRYEVRGTCTGIALDKQVWVYKSLNLLFGKNS
jgi:hypothetical protein